MVEEFVPAVSVVDVPVELLVPVEWLVPSVWPVDVLAPAVSPTEELVVVPSVCVLLTP